jgi:hypothetical protein
MSDPITALNNLHVPVVLIGAAILFILVAIVGGGIKGVLVVPPISKVPRIILGISGVLFLLLGLVIAAVPPTISSPTVVATPTPAPAFNPIPTNFNVTVIKLNNGQVLQAGQPIPVSRSPLTITGTYSTKGSRQVWVLVQDTYGKYYLQNPPVAFGDTGQWTASNIITAVGTIKILFVCATAQGNSVFQQMVATGPSGFTLLPEGSQILQEIPIRMIAG